MRTSSDSCAEPEKYNFTLRLSGQYAEILISVCLATPLVGVVAACARTERDVVIRCQEIRPEEAPPCRGGGRRSQCPACRRGADRPRCRRICKPRPARQDCRAGCCCNPSAPLAMIFLCHNHHPVGREHAPV